MSQLKILNLSQTDAAKKSNEVREKTEELLNVCSQMNYAGHLAGDDHLLLRFLMGVIRFTQCDSANEHLTVRKKSNG